MFERFTDRARRVVMIAQEEARGLKHNYIGTEHLLLGLIVEGEGLGAQTLQAVGLTADAARQAVADMVGRGSEPQQGHMPFTPRAKTVLELSLRQALRLQHNYIGTEHILLGLLEEGEGVAAQILRANVEGSQDRIRESLSSFMGQPLEPAAGQGRSWRPQGLQFMQRDIAVRLEAIEARLSAIEALLREQRANETG